MTYKSYQAALQTEMFAPAISPFIRRAVKPGPSGAGMHGAPGCNFRASIQRIFLYYAQHGGVNIPAGVIAAKFALFQMQIKGLPLYAA